MLEIRQLNRQALQGYIDAPEFGMGNFLPITKHRAISHIKNPRVSNTDVLLLLAYFDGELIGYLGILPDYLYPRGEQAIKIGWLSCLWVSETARGKGISVQLMLEASALYQNRLLSADFVPATKRLYDNSGLFEKSSLQKQGIRLYVRSNLAQILPPKHVLFRKFESVLSVSDVVINTFIRLRSFKPNISNLKIEEVDLIDNECIHFIHQCSQFSLCRRGPEELHWILQFPWVLSAPEKSDLDKKYYFSSTAKEFSYRALKVKNTDGKLIAFMIFTVMDKNLKLPYLYHNGFIDRVIDVINFCIISWQIKTFTVFHPELSQRLNSSKTAAILSKPIQRSYMVSKGLKDYFTKMDNDVSDGDGDCCFT
ncbi:MAG: GNAT family N-acetyltransferase [Saprospiraceae bacterium]